MNALYLDILNKKTTTSIFLKDAIERSLQKSFVKLYMYSEYIENNANDKITITKDLIKEILWDIIIIQNSFCLKIYEEVLKSIRKNIPIIFFSHERDIDGQIDFSRKIGRIFFTKDSYYGQLNTLPHTIYNNSSFKI